MSSVKPFRVLLVGAGEINFGSPEGPWSHSLRLERRFGTSLEVLGIIDPALDKAREQLAAKTAAGTPGYAQSATWSTPEEAAAALGQSDVDLIIVGCPPHFRGGTSPTTNLDLRLLKAFPHCKRWLVEKPVSAAAPSLEAGQHAVLDAYTASGAVVGVGYMLKALKAVEKMQSIIKEKDLTVMGTQARYYMAYEYARKPSWWNKTISCGPVVEQATHLISLSLAFGGKARLDSVFAHVVRPDEKPGQLSKLGFDESQIPPEDRVPRYTNAIWKYETGAVGSLVHVIGLHGQTYDTEFEVIADGYTFKLVDMYTACPRLYIRYPGEAVPKVVAYDGDDPFQTQIDALVADSPVCTYSEALSTYELSWAMRLAGERDSRAA